MLAICPALRAFQAERCRVPPSLPSVQHCCIWVGGREIADQLPKGASCAALLATPSLQVSRLIGHRGMLHRLQ